MVPAAHIDPFQMTKPRFDRIENAVPCGAQWLKPLLAQIVKVDAVNAFHMLWRELVDWKAKP